MAKRVAVVLVLAAFSLVAIGCISISVGPVSPQQVHEVIVRKSPRFRERKRVVLLDLDGFLSSAGEPWFLGGGTSVADVKEKLDRAAQDGRVRAVVLRINSPGGEVSATDTIYREILRFKEQSGKPVVAALMSTAASGGYYVALAADRVVCSPTTVTGSVGVVMHYVNLEGLLGKIGLRSEVIKSGEKKDMGSPRREMTEQESEILQHVNQALFDGFLEVVRAGRPQMTEADVAAISDGRIVTATQALELHMVDRIGYLHDAIEESKQLAGIQSAHVVLYRAFPHYNSNIYAAGGGGGGPMVGAVERALSVLVRRRAVTFLYLWSPGW